ncbi:MAG: PEPxxWA-CTERM sorting domain-containing protein [Sphingomonadaceae bacterium]
MKKAFLALAAVAAVALAAPAQAVVVTGISAGKNAAGVFDSGPGLLQLDFTFNRGGAIVVGLQAEAGDANGIRFDSIVDVFTGVTLGLPLRTLAVGLVGGPVFTTIGDVTPAFSTAVVSPFDIGIANGIFIDFTPGGEFFGLTLGNIDGDAGDFLIGLGSLQPGDKFALVLLGIVPEPGTWAMMIAGFGLVGGAMRRRRALAHLPA